MEILDEAVFGGLAFMDEAVEQGEGYIGVAEQGGPFADGGVGGDDNRGAPVDTINWVEQQLAAGPCEKQIPNHSSKRDPKVGQSLKLRAHVGIQNSLHCRGPDQ